jgi:hypothetical protein
VWRQLQLRHKQDFYDYQLQQETAEVFPVQLQFLPLRHSGIYEPHQQPEHQDHIPE